MTGKVGQLPHPICSVLAPNPACGWFQETRKREAREMWAGQIRLLGGSQVASPGSDRDAAIAAAYVVTVENLRPSC